VADSMCHIARVRQYVSDSTCQIARVRQYVSDSMCHTVCVKQYHVSDNPSQVSQLKDKSHWLKS